ncbi:hypothetical protein GQ457_17G005180 [Hibiscus cannabinus]
MEHGRITEWTKSLCCSAGTLPSTYLGLPLGYKRNSPLLWRPVLEKFRTRLAPWKARYLTLGGRVLLAKSVLSNLSVYYLSLFKMPVKVSTEFNRLVSNFIWNSLDRRKIHWVN